MDVRHVVSIVPGDWDKSWTIEEIRGSNTGRGKIFLGGEVGLFRSALGTGLSFLRSKAAGA